MRWRRRLAFAAGLLLLAAGATCGAAAYELGRIDRVALELPGSPPGGTTFLLIGSDSRAFADSPAEREAFGSPDVVSGARADVVVLLRVAGERADALVLPRDVVLPRPDGVGGRLTLFLLDGPQAVVDVVCDRLGVGVDHVVLVEIPGFRRIVDALGGIDVDIDRPIRDARSGLVLDRAGRHHLDGTSALAFVRARQARVRVGGHWTPEPDGSTARAARLSAALGAVGARLGDWWRHPVRSARVVHAATGSLRVSSNAGTGDLLRLRRALGGLGGSAGSIAVLPVDQRDRAVPVAFLVPRAAQVLAGFGRDAAGSACPAEPLPVGTAAVGNRPAGAGGG